MLDSLISEGHPLARDLAIELASPPGARKMPLDNIPIRQVGRTGGHFWEQVQLPSSLDSGGLLSLCNTGPLLCSRHIVCIHDANVWNAPTSYSLAFRILYRTILPLLAKTARRVSTVSDYSMSELVRHGVNPAAHFLVAPNGHEHALRWRPRHSEATRRAASGNTVVMVGSPAPHKNIGLILGMADRLADAGIDIAIVGAADPRVFQGQVRTEAPNIHWVGRVSDGEMAALLKDSLCLAFPSLTEGFGLPALEAMTLGCAVVATDRASLPEVCGSAALYASPDDPEAWFTSFVRLRNSPELRREMIARGQERASVYSWRLTALRYLNAMAEADGLQGFADADPVGSPIQFDRTG